MPTDAPEDLWSAAIALQRQNRLDEAADLYGRLLAIDPGFVAAHGARGFAHLGLGRFAAAVADFDQVLARQPGHAGAHGGRGLALGELGHLEAALGAHRQAAALSPSDPRPQFELARALARLKRREEALLAYGRALTLDPSLSEALFQQGGLLLGLGRPQEALDAYDRLLAANPDDPRALHDRAIALYALLRLDEAVAAAERALVLDPDAFQARYSLALIRLAQGDLTRGLPDFEYRWGLTQAPPDAAAPPWRGEDMRGTSILVHWEQGLGDTIQFCRYLPLLAARGARVVFAAQPVLHRLLASLEGGIALVDPAKLPAGLDYAIPLMSLPLAFGARLDALPADIPYLAAEPELVDQWRRRIGGHGFKIGLAWRGDPAGTQFGKDIQLSLLAPLASLPGVRLISLQKDAGDQDFAGLPPGMTIERPVLDDGGQAFVDTAAVMASLDLVISVDTAVAHLAGALGRPAWVALKYAPDWRWLLGRDDSPWYPTLKLFRQPQLGDWPAVVAAMARALREALRP